MDEYIERKALIKDIENDSMTVLFDKMTAIHHVKRQPAADVVEVRHGKWIDDMRDITTVAGIVRKYLVGYNCSVCGRYEIHKEPYCNCGAKMDLGDDEK